MTADTVFFVTFVWETTTEKGDFYAAWCNCHGNAGEEERKKNGSIFMQKKMEPNQLSGHEDFAKDK